MSQFNYKMLRALMREKLHRDQPTMLVLERATGITKSTFFRVLKNEGGPNTQSLAKLCAWLGITPSLLIKREGTLSLVDLSKPTLKNIHLIMLQDESLDKNAVTTILRIMELGYMLATK